MGSGVAPAVVHRGCRPVSGWRCRAARLVDPGPDAGRRVPAGPRRSGPARGLERPRRARRRRAGGYDGRALSFGRPVRTRRRSHLGRRRVRHPVDRRIRSARARRTSCCSRPPIATRTSASSIRSPAASRPFSCWSAAWLAGAKLGALAGRRRPARRPRRPARARSDRAGRPARRPARPRDRRHDRRLHARRQRGHRARVHDRVPRARTRACGRCRAAGRMRGAGRLAIRSPRDRPRDRGGRPGARSARTPSCSPRWRAPRQRRWPPFGRRACSSPSRSGRSSSTSA